MGESIFIGLSRCIKNLKDFETMKIYGIGTDIINIQRIKKSLNNKKFEKEFLIKLKYLDVNYKQIKLTVLPKDLQLKKPSLKLLELEYRKE